MIKKLYFLLGFIYSIDACAQAPYDGINKMPNILQGDFGQSPGTYTEGNINVDLYTGIANVNIPIYSHIVDGLDMGISLSYNAKGIKVDQLASSVGLGWELNVGGYIEREIKGLEDEATIPSYFDPISGGQQTNIIVGPRLSSGFRRPTSFSDETIARTSSYIYYAEYRGSWVTHNFVETTNHGIRDTRYWEDEADCFTAVFAGRVIKFAIKNGQVSTSANTEIKIQTFIDGIEYTPGSIPYTNVDASISSGLLSFVITDEKGNKFKFHRGAFEYKKHPRNSNYTYYPIQRWVLTSVTTYTGKLVEFDYFNFPPISLGASIEYEAGMVDEVKESVSLNNSNYFKFDNAISEPVIWKGVIYPIKSITYNDRTSVSFDISSTPRCDLISETRLNKIKISQAFDDNLTNSLTYIFDYAYFNSVSSSSSTFSPAEIPIVEGGTCNYITTLASAEGISTDEAKKRLQRGLRLKLKAIRQIGKDLTTSEPYYRFEYDYTYKLPPRLSQSQDLYGYYNGATTASYHGQYLAVPYHAVYDNQQVSNPIYYYGVSKTPVFGYLKSSVLTSVTNALGGVTTLNYQEPPNLKDISISSFPKNINGLDGKDSYDGLCISRITIQDNFSANKTQSDFYFSGGYRLIPGMFFWYPTYYVTATNKTAERGYLNNPVMPINYVHGSTHGFDKASVKKINQSNEVLLDAEYTFSNISSLKDINDIIDNKLNAYSNMFERYYQKNSAFGLPLIVNTFNPSHQLVQQTKYNYEYVDVPEMINKEYHIYYNPINTNIERQQQFYKIFDADISRISSKTTYEYVNTSISNSEYYSYDNHNNLATIKWQDSRLDWFRKRYYHNYDYTFPPGANVPADKLALINTMNQKPVQFTLAEELLKLNKPQNTNADIANLDDPNKTSIVSYSQILPNYVNDRFTVKQIVNATIRTPVPFNTFYNNDKSVNFFYVYNNNVADKTEFTEYDYNWNNNAIEIWSKNHTKCNSAIYDVWTNQAIANVSNAEHRDIAYTSFEQQITNGTNWNFNYNSVYFHNNSKALTGKYSYVLSGAQNENIASVNTLTLNKRYLLSLWVQGTAPGVFIGSSSFPYVQTISLTQQTQVGDWKLYTSYITGTGTLVSIVYPGSGSCKVDELRLHPADATMKTTTYDAIFGPSSECNERNNIVYYEYDNFGRPYVTRDFNGNVLTVIKHVIQGNDN